MDNNAPEVVLGLRHNSAGRKGGVWNRGRTGMILVQ